MLTVVFLHPWWVDLDLGRTFGWWSATVATSFQVLPKQL